MVNLATYVGSHQAGLAGALLATLAVVLPSFLIILLVMGVLGKTLKNRYVQAVLRGLKPCVAGIVLATGLFMLLDSFVFVQSGLAVKPAAIAAILFALMLGSKKFLHRKLSPIMLIVASGVLGVLFYA